MKKLSTLALLFVAIIGTSPAAFAADLVDVSKPPSQVAQGAPAPVSLQAEHGSDYGPLIACLSSGTSSVRGVDDVQDSCSTSVRG
ncbi:hypothetical protein PS663_02257 [Pseudomonas fluorescens]|uniref:hypothetical protein n=1 Tax=Pseudomonas rhodesiae TaxID=76760 RepID=UPI0012581EB3|nr:hypothetical protein PS663_02257 [Pseudomonas fluorescens]